MKHLQPATAMFKGAAGNRLVADVYGDGGQPVMLLHGGGQTRHAWRRTAEQLARTGAMAYALDQRGHGDSEWPADGTSSDSAISSRSPALSINRMPAPPTINPRTNSGRRAASTTLMRAPSE